MLVNSDWVPHHKATEVLKGLLNNCDVIEKINSKDAVGWTPLMVACQK